MNRRPKVIIDPGHGGRDPGAVGPTGLREKDVTLAVSKAIAQYLQPVADVVLTRSEDKDFAGQVFSSSACIGARGQIVNSSGADVCVSVHCNAHTNRDAHGVETFHHPSKPDELRLARSIQLKLVGATGRANRGVKTANFGMIRLPKMPSALVELPFISNPKEEALLRSPDFQATCASAIAMGIAEFLGVGGRLHPPAPQVATPAASPRVLVNGRPTEIELRMIDGKLWGPLRGIAEALGADVDWDGPTQTASIKTKG